MAETIKETGIYQKFGTAMKRSIKLSKYINGVITLKRICMDITTQFDGEPGPSAQHHNKP